MPRSKTLIAMGILPLAVLGGAMLRGPEGSDPAAPPVTTEGLVLVAAENVAPAGPPVGHLCGATTDALRCRSSD